MIFIPKVNWPACPHCGEKFLLTKDFEAHLPDCSGLRGKGIAAMLHEMFEALERKLEENDE